MATEISPSISLDGPQGGFNSAPSHDEHTENEPLTAAEITALRAPKVPPGVDPTKQQLAYGRRAVPKLIENLAPTKPLALRQQSLVFLAELFHKPENAYLALEEGIVEKLVSPHVIDEVDLTVRQKGMECLRLLSGHAVGRNGIVAGETLVPLSKLFNDPDPLVRLNVHKTFSFITQQSTGIDALLTSNLFSALIAKLPFETIDIQLAILDTCYNVIRHGKPPHIPRDALDCGAMEVYTKMLKVGCVSEVLVGVARCVMVLSQYKPTKPFALQHNTIPALLALLKHRKSTVRAAAAGALMNITIDVEAKRLVVRENGLPFILELLKDKDENVLLNAVKCITNCGEDYRGRFFAHSSLSKLQSFYESPNTQLAEAAKRAVSVITWRP